MAEEDEEKEPSRRRFRVGYALAPKKIHSFIQSSLLDLSKKRGIDLISIDIEKPLVDQGPFDCVLHKLYGDEWRKQLEEFVRLNPNACVIDPPEAIERLHNRISMLQVVSELKIADESDTFGIPKQIVIYDSWTLFDRQTWGGLKFPVVAKPLVADGSTKSHKMSLVFNHDGLNKLKPPIVLQEFVNHGGVIFKVYVVGEHVQFVKRKSLPDVPEEKLCSLEASLSFSQVSNFPTNQRSDDNYYETMHLEETKMPPQSFITEIARGLRRAMRLNLFNFDVIRDASIGNRYLVIDINYFPGYAKMPSYESVLTDFFWDVVHRNEKGANNCFDIGDSSESGHDKAQVRSCDDNEVMKCVGNSFCSDGDDGSLIVSSSSRDEKEGQVQF